MFVRLLPPSPIITYRFLSLETLNVISMLLLFSNKNALKQLYLTDVKDYKVYIIVPI